MTDERLNTLIGGIASTLDAIHVQIARIADAVAGAVQDEEPEEMVHVHGNPIPARVVREIQARLCSGEKLTPARLCREYSQSPATMQHMIDDYERTSIPSPVTDEDDQRCRHPARRVTGTRVECMDCGEVIKDQGTPLLKTIEFEPDPDMPEPAYVYEPGHRPLSDHEVELLRQLAAEQQRNRDLEERLVALNRQLVQCEHRKTLGDDDVDAD
uniref:Uncharacterized protein n=1 Tax=viral metagenome TaxID=1070528 RepID=A0A6M3XD35_9ZZZZ